MSRRVLVALTIAGGLVMVLVSFAFNGLGAAGTVQPTRSPGFPVATTGVGSSVPTETVTASSPPLRVPGVPAIAANPNTPTGVAAYGTQDVKSYFQSHPNLADAFADPNSAPPTIANIEFTTAGELAAKSQNVPSSRSGTDLLCVVTLKGVFKKSGAPPDPEVFTFGTSTMYFDGHTGNLLMNSLGDPIR